MSLQQNRVNYVERVELSVHYVELSEVYLHSRKERIVSTQQVYRIGSV